MGAGAGVAGAGVAGAGVGVVVVVVVVVGVPGAGAGAWPCGWQAATRTVAARAETTVEILMAVPWKIPA